MLWNYRSHIIIIVSSPILSWCENDCLRGICSNTFCKLLKSRYGGNNLCAHSQTPPTSLSYNKFSGGLHLILLRNRTPKHFTLCSGSQAGNILRFLVPPLDGDTHLISRGFKSRPHFFYQCCGVWLIYVLVGFHGFKMLGLEKKTIANPSFKWNCFLNPKLNHQSLLLPGRICRGKV